MRTPRLIKFCKLYIRIRNNNDYNIKICNTPTSLFSQVDSYPLKLTNCFLSTYILFIERHKTAKYLVKRPGAQYDLSVIELYTTNTF